MYGELNQEKVTEDLMKENKILQEINDRGNNNLNDLVREHLSAEHQAAITWLGESHAFFWLDLVDCLHFSSRCFSRESFLSEEKAFCFDFSFISKEKNIVRLN